MNDMSSATTELGEATLLAKMPDTLSMAADIVSAYVTHNSLPASDLPTLIVTIHQSLLSIGSPEVKKEAPKKKPAVSIRKSITDEFLVCLEDGNKFKTLKRHLLITYNMTPDQYRAKWGLAGDYPMTAPSYSAKRSSLAKAAGLGVNRSAETAKKTAKPRTKKAA